MMGVSRARGLKGALFCSAAIVGLATAPGALAETFEITDEVSAVTNLSVSVGASVRTQRQRTDTITPQNGLRNGISGGTAESASADDGNLNFDQGDIVTAPVTVLGDVEFKHSDGYGFFLRGKAFSDLRLEFGGVDHGNILNGYEAGAELDDSRFQNLSRFSSVALLDAFGYVEFDAFDKPVELRAGRQVLSWGEGLFIQGGINSINPVDVNAFRRPGSRIKEGLLPVGMGYANVGLTDNLSVEGFLQLEFQETAVDGCGTFFASTDVAATGCGAFTLPFVPNVPVFGTFPDTAATGAPIGALVDVDDEFAAANEIFLARTSDETPDLIGPDRFGVAFRYFSDSLDTEFGFYYHRTSSRTPIFSVTEGNYAVNAQTNASIAGAAAGATPTAIPGVFTAAPGNAFVAGTIDSVLAGSGTGVTSADPLAAQIAVLEGIPEGAAVSGGLQFLDPGISEADLLNGIAASLFVGGNALPIVLEPDEAIAAIGGGTIVPGTENPTFFLEFPDQIDMFGVSASTEISGISFGAELSYRPNQPVQINTNDLAFAILSGGDSSIFGLATNPADALVNGAAPGARIDGFRLAHQVRGQMNAVTFFDQVAGADRVTLIGEAGFEALNIRDDDDLNFGRSSAYGTANDAGNDAPGLITNFSWGYRTRVQADYSNVFLGVNMRPSITWTHDVTGTSSDGSFVANRLGVGAGVTFDYLSKYQLDFNYVNFFNGGNNFDIASDRDFASVLFTTRF